MSDDPETEERLEVTSSDLAEDGAALAEDRAEPRTVQMSTAVIASLIAAGVAAVGIAAIGLSRPAKVRTVEREVEVTVPVTVEAAENESSASTTTSTTVRERSVTVAPLAGDVGFGETGDLIVNGDWRVTDWLAGGETLATAGIEWNDVREGSDLAEQAVIVTTGGADRAEGVISLSDDTPAGLWVVPVQVRVDGAVTKTGEVTLADPFTFTVDISDSRRVEIALGASGESADEAMGFDSCVCVVLEALRLVTE